MVSYADIGWGSYKQYSGPYYKGKCPYVLPADPTEAEMLMRVVSATEGGRFDAFNGYDSCGWTSGLIQWCEAGQYSVSDMLGGVALNAPDLLVPVYERATELGLVFARNSRRRFRFYFQDARGEVDRKQEQQELFYGPDVDGGGMLWTAEGKEYALKWAAAISTVWEHSDAQKVQTKYTANRIHSFAYSTAKPVVDNAPATAWGQAFVALYLSFAANNPKHAKESLEIANSWNTSNKPYGKDWVLAFLKQVIFGGSFAIYPHRYDVVRPVVEQLYGVDLPDLAGEVKVWQGAENGFRHKVSPQELQEGLLILGYDLGPKGADGIIGDKTRTAVRDFMLSKRQTGFLSHITGDPDGHFARALEVELEQHGRTLLLTQ